METVDSRDKEDSQWRQWTQGTRKIPNEESGLKGQGGYPMEAVDSRNKDTQWREWTQGTRRTPNGNSGLKEQGGYPTETGIPNGEKFLFIHKHTKYIYLLTQYTLNLKN